MKFFSDTLSLLIQCDGICFSEGKIHCRHYHYRFRNSSFFLGVNQQHTQFISRYLLGEGSMQFGSDDLKIQKLHDYQFSGFSNEKKNCSNFFLKTKNLKHIMCANYLRGEFSCFVLNLGILIKKNCCKLQYSSSKYQV